MPFLKKLLYPVKGMSSNNDSEKDVFRACAEHSWQAHGPGGRDGEEGRYAKHDINSVEELEAHIRASVQDEKTKGFVASNDREVYMSTPNADGYSTEVILNYQRDEKGNIIGGTCVLTDRPESELKRLQEREKDISGKTPEIKLQNAYTEIRKELPRDNKQKAKQAEPEKALTWYEVSQKRSALHTPAENKQRAPTPPPARPLADAEPPEQKKTPEESLLESLRKQEQERQEAKRQHKGRGRSPMGDLLSSHFNRKSKR
ncbi:MAG: hypothetical protein V9G98_03765 [Candidatus Competibacter sp.]